MLRLRRITILMAALVMVAAACSGDDGGNSDTDQQEGGSGEPVTLDYWVFESGGLAGSFAEQLIQEFEADNPNVTINVTAYPEDNYGVKLDTAIAAGKEPDLVLVFGPEQMREGLLLPLDDMVAENDIDLSSFVPSIVEPGDEFSCSYEGSLYCLGSYAGSVQMLYNKDLFDAAGIEYPAAYPPMTPEEFVDTACQLTDEANGVWGGAASDPLAYAPWETFFSDDGRTAIFNSPEAVAQFEVLASGYERGCLPTSNVLDPWEQGRDYFARGELAMVITDFQDLDKVEKAGINWGSTASPTPSGEDPYFFVWTDSVGVMASSDHPEEAKAFIGFLATRGQELRVETSGDVPLDLQVAEDVNWSKGVPGREDGLEVLSNARTAVFVPNRWDVIGPYYDAWGFVIGGEKSAQEALDEANGAIQENLDKAWEDWEEAA
ncbi:MAG TPA: sugar ABC transporter substrate-binding protein [Actinomycetota bacterium]|nr:sugar ABC transporter substrate-binding protein [Actinomycetota bacterium]